MFGLKNGKSRCEGYGQSAEAEGARGAFEERLQALLTRQQAEQHADQRGFRQRDRGRSHDMVVGKRIDRYEPRDAQAGAPRSEEEHEKEDRGIRRDGGKV